MIHSYVTHLLDIIFPPHCIVCKKEGTSLCAKCTIVFHRAPDTPHPYILSTFSFKDSRVKHIIHSLKYYHRRDVIPALTHHLADDMRTQNYTGLLIPIPIPLSRRYMRGYNQAEEIAKGLSRELFLPYTTTFLLRASSPSRQVTHTKRSERLLNQRGSFIATDKVHGLDIILVDDVTTTGATLDEARKTLLNKGARSVRAVTLAH